MLPATWIAHHRPSDGELVGYLCPEESGYRPRTVFGYPLSPVAERVEAVRTLETRGLASLAEGWTLLDEDGDDLRVQILTASPERVVVVEAPYGYYEAGSPRFVLPVPTDRLIPASRR